MDYTDAQPAAHSRTQQPRRSNHGPTAHESKGKAAADKLVSLHVHESDKTPGNENSLNSYRINSTISA